MTTFRLRPLLNALEQFPGLQRKEWELNQSGADRGMEAVLIQRSRRELATYTLCRLRLAAMPDLAEACRGARRASHGMPALLEWARTQGAGGSALANLVEERSGEEARGEELFAALASLKYYHRRGAPNPTVKAPWTEEDLDRLVSFDTGVLLEYPTRGAFWGRKFETVKRLVSHVRATTFETMDDEELLRSLSSIPGVGEQTADMVALFWLGRPVPIIDSYLLRLLRNHGFLPVSFSGKAAERTELRQHLAREACDIEAQRPDWPAARVLSCLYLWACEVGRFHCRCATGDSASCPLRKGG